MRVGVLSDPHVALPGTPDRRWIDVVRLSRSRELFRAGLRELFRCRVDLIALLGDLTQSGDARQTHWLLDELEHSPVPVLLVEGNHDVGNGLGILTRLLAARSASQVRHADPVGHDMDGTRLAGGRLHGVGQDWVCALDAPPDPARWPVGSLTLWLSHHPVISLSDRLSGLGLPYAGDLRGREEVLTALRSHTGPVLALTGHLHVRAHATVGNVLQLDHAAVVEQPHDVSVLDIEQARGTVVVTRRDLRVPGAPPPGAPASVLDPEVNTWRWQGSTWQCVAN
jgi:3',5'-cyclic AMP phosphodiesterase CpdA